jgi:hypothetical protein
MFVDEEALATRVDVAVNLGRFHRFVAYGAVDCHGPLAPVREAAAGVVHW